LVSVLVVTGNNQRVSCVYTEQQGVSFIETSALNSSNVETAFKSLLTGNYTLCLKKCTNFETV